jgi:type IV secretion system protein TrbF
MTDHNPYLAARREWNERYGSYIAQARNWRLGFFGILAVLGLSVAGNVIQGTQSKIKPMLVELDRLGQPVNVQMVVNEQGAKTNPKVIQYLLASYVTDARSVIPSGEALKTQLMRVRAMSGEATWATLLDYYQIGKDSAEHDPFTIAKTSLVTVDVAAMLPLDANTWQVEWTETRKNALTGMLEGKTAWKGVIGVKVEEPDNYNVAKLNPLGVYVTSFTWTQPFNDKK